MFDAAARVISMWGYTEGLLEGTAEVVRTETHAPRQCRKRYLLGYVILDIGSYDPLLPRCQPALDSGLDAICTTKLHEFVHEHGSQRFKVGEICRLWVLQEPAQLNEGTPEHWIVEKQPRRCEHARIGVRALIL